MKDEVPYGVSYIATSPDELRIGDKVEVLADADMNKDIVGKKALVSQIYSDNTLLIKIGRLHYAVTREKIRKCADSDFIVGDTVCVVDKKDDNYGKTAVVKGVQDDCCIIHFGGDKVYDYYAHQLRKVMDNPLGEQVGGNHYKDMEIQPVEFCMKNKLDFCTSSAIKYLCRRKKKNGKEDLLKAKHFIDLLIQLEYPE